MLHPSPAQEVLVKSIIYLLGFFFSLVAYATPVPSLEYSASGPQPVEVGARMLYLEDPLRQYDVDEVIANPSDWNSINQASPNFGFTKSAYWFRFNITNLDMSVQDIFLELPIPFLDDVQIFRINQTTIDENIDVLEQHEVGDQFPFSERPVIDQDLILPFELLPGTNEFLVRITSEGTIEAPLFIWNPQSFGVSNADDRLVQGIWFGIVIIMVIYNFFLYVMLRDISYLYYVAFACSYLMFQVCLKGYGFAYLWPNMTDWNAYSISVFIALCNFFAYMLVMSFLDLRRHSPRGYRITSTMASISALFVILTFILPYSTTVRMNAGMVLITCITSLTIAYWSWYNENRYAKYFCLAWTAAFAGVGVLVAAKFGVLPANFWTENAGQIGILMLVSLLSLALANRFNREKELRILAQDSSLHNERLARRSQEELLEARVEANKRLEQKVAERTETLERAMAELETVNQRLEIMSTTDSLTGLSNRGHFENRLMDEFQRAQRHKRDLSIILCDIDLFKTINDTFGHKAGDECLISIATLFQQRIARTGDVVARYGGEEFIFLLADTPLENAKQIAQDLCDSVRALNFHFNAQPIPVTASFGVSSMAERTLESPDQLVTEADLALYQAKNANRDQVVSWKLEASS